MAAIHVNLEKCVLFKCLCGVWKLNRSLHLLLKYSIIFGHTDESNTSFESVKTIRCLFVCTQNNNETLCFCKIKQTGCASCRLVLVSVNFSAKLCV